MCVWGVLKGGSFFYGMKIKLLTNGKMGLYIFLASTKTSITYNGKTQPKKERSWNACCWNIKLNLDNIILL